MAGWSALLDGLGLRWRHWQRQRQLARTAIPDALWQLTLSRYPFLPASGPDAPRLREAASLFLDGKEFSGANGLEMNDEIAVAIAAQAVLPVLHCPPGLDWFDDFVGIVVHPAQVRARREWTDEDGVVHQGHEVLAGEAMDGGPVTLSWQDVASAGDTAAQGYNVVIHEFVHKMDLRDGEPDGCPPMPAALRREWRRVLDDAFRSHREAVSAAERFGSLAEPVWLDAYGATAIDEFFAVSAEAYFVARERLAADHPQLVVLYDRFFRSAAAT